MGSFVGFLKYMVAGVIIAFAAYVVGIVFPPEKFVTGLVAKLTTEAAATPSSAAAPTLPPSAALAPAPAAPQATAENPMPKTDPSLKVTEFVDVARLVLEHNRDMSNETAKHIERAVNIVIGLLTLLAAFGAWLGWNKVSGLEEKAKGRIDKFNQELDELRSGAAAVRDEFSKSLEAATTELRAEINCRMELLTARAEIALAEAATVPTEQMQLFASAIARIERALEVPHLPVTIKIKGLADLGYSKKRSGDTEGALKKVVEADALARSGAPDMVPLLAYNAACYSAILDRADVQQWLEKAILGGEVFRENAARDADFAKVRHLEWFQLLMVKK